MHKTTLNVSPIRLQIKYCLLSEYAAKNDRIVEILKSVFRSSKFSQLSLLTKERIRCSIRGCHFKLFLFPQMLA